MTFSILIKGIIYDKVWGYCCISMQIFITNTIFLKFVTFSNEKQSNVFLLTENMLVLQI